MVAMIPQGWSIERETVFFHPSDHHSLPASFRAPSLGNSSQNQRSSERSSESQRSIQTPRSLGRSVEPPKSRETQRSSDSERSLETLRLRETPRSLETLRSSKTPSETRRSVQTPKALETPRSLHTPRSRSRLKTRKSLDRSFQTPRSLETPHATFERRRRLAARQEKLSLPEITPRPLVQQQLLPLHKVNFFGERSPGDGEAADESDDGHPASPPHHPVVDDEEDEGDDDEDDDEDDEDVEDPMDDDDDDADPKDDDELVDNIYDDEVESDDSDGYSLQSAGAASRQGSASTVRNLKSATKRLLGLSLETKTSTAGRTSSGQARPASASTSSTGDLQPALMPSLFPGVPPTVNFVPDGEKVEQLPWEIRKLLKWKMSPITPNVVKNCIARSGFRATKRNHDWIGYWGKHMKAPGFKAIREYQKVNHFPGSFQIGRKDRLWRNLSKMQVQFGKKEYGFFPQTFVLPYDIKQLKRAWEDGGNKQKWIIKPPASARGIGIKVINKWNQIPKRRPIIVQRYISRPLLIQESKFDIRLYVYVTSYDPLRIYVYDDGLARFASCKYSNSLKSLNNRYMHLTNYSINKKNTDYQNNSDENVCQGHKWGLKALWGYMKTQGINTGAVWESMKDVIIKTVIASEPYVNPMMKANARRRYCCHELFGFDIMLDDTLKPWLIEVNISPSLHSNSTLDINIKGGMIKDLLNIAGFQIPDKNDVKESPSNASANTGGASNKEQQENSNNNGAPVIYMDKRLFCGSLTPDERSKHAYYCQRHADEIIQQTILEVLTPDDVRMMVETVDEDSRRCSMQRIFPCNISHKYLRFFEQPRYYNLLLDAWVQKYNRMEQRGVAYLEFVCSRGVHLENPTDDPKHQWSPPNLSVPRDSRANSAPAKGLVPNSVLPKLRKKRIGALATSSTSSLPTPRHHPHPPSRNSQPSH